MWKRERKSCVVLVAVLLIWSCVPLGMAFAQGTAPTVTGVNPSYGPEVGGTFVTITGTGFAVATAVYFGPNKAVSFSVYSDNQITTTSPTGAGVVDVTVDSPGGVSAVSFADHFNFLPNFGGGGGRAVSYASSVSSSGSSGTTTLAEPTLQTEAASSITADSAVLNGDITASGGSNVTGYGFLWGTSQNSLTTNIQVGTNNQSGSFVTTLSNLTADTTYYFEAYATNSSGTTDGTVLSFTTMGAWQGITSPAARVFPDVPVSYWAYKEISSLSSKGIVVGYPDGTFKPDAYITRAEFATMLSKALGLNTSGTTGMFTDVTEGAWYYGFVNAAASAGLVPGTGNNMFAPQGKLAREQVAVMIANALGNKAPAVAGTELNAFNDSSAVSSWAVTGMEKAVKAGIVNGMTTVTLAPMIDATRAQAAVMIYQMLNVL